VSHYAIKSDEQKRAVLGRQTVGYDAGDPEPGQGRAAAVCSLAQRTLDAVEGQYAESWLLVRLFAPTAMMTGGGFNIVIRLVPSICLTIRPSNHVTPLKQPFPALVHSSPR
jgi:hypothetical protein